MIKLLHTQKIKNEGRKRYEKTRKRANLCGCRERERERDRATL